MAQTSPPASPTASPPAPKTGNDPVQAMVIGAHDFIAGQAAGILQAGGTVIAQNEETCVVWGMPRAVAVAGLCSDVLPLGEIAGRLNRLAGGK